MGHAGTRHTLLAAAAIALLGVTLVGAAPALAADLLRPYHHHHYRYRSTGTLAIFRGDRACPREEPSDYRPRTVNFNEPLCYAARPYGISVHLYNHSTLLDVTQADEYQGGY